MEDDVGVKVTRLRRRLSVEQSEDGGSPAPSTPSKKRGGRLAAKPQLELIDENAQVNSPRKTRRKSLATEAEEKPITPSRRSTRIKSNSSIVSETLSVQATDSPRAKRAARRNSTAGSDNDGPATPVRQTRRTRKDSASSVENQESGTVLKLPVAEMVIEEEPENEVQKTANNSKSSPSVADAEKLSPNSARKSKRLLEKRNRRSGSFKSDQDSSTVENKSLNISTSDEKIETDLKDTPSKKSAKSKKMTIDLSKSNECLLENLDTESKINTSNHNKSATALDTAVKYESKRTRTESWPAVTVSSENNSIHFSDNELSNKKKSDTGLNTTNSSKVNKSNKSINEINTSQLSLDTSSRIKKNQSDNIEDTPKLSEDLKEKETDKSDNSNLAKLFDNVPGNVQATIYFEDSDSNSVGAKIENVDSEDQCVPNANLNTENKTNQVNIEKTHDPDISIPKIVNDDVNNSCEPMDIDETIHEEILHKSLETHQSNKSLKLSQRSIIDESTSKRKSSISNSGTNTPVLSRDNKRKSSISNSGANTPDKSKNDKRNSSITHSITDTSFQSKDNKRKSSISSCGTDTPDQSKNEKRKSSISNSTADTPDLFKNNTNNKSTLILSQLKDVSSTSENHKSPKLVINEVLSKSDINEKDNKSKKVSKGNLSLNDVKGTPRQTTVQKLTMQTSTPITMQQLGEKAKTEELKHEGTKKNKSNFSKSMNDTSSSEEDSDGNDNSPVTNNEHIDDEAEEASNDYESGDSQDEEERRYEKENEIVERGETLTSDDDVSTDTDYEKDSFVVSSDEEDEEFLSGSGDDLSMSDNELTMGKKSKNKYNKRKLKEQKNASREMFESRHKLNDSDQKSPKTKKNRMRIDSSLLASDEEVVPKPKKTNRMRLDSTHDASFKSEKTNESLNKSNRNKSTLDTSHTLGDINRIDEKEITLNESTKHDADPLQALIKQEPKTPHKDLNISVVQFTDRQEIENIQITEGNSIMNQTGTDPLQTTMACEDDSDSSESEEILQNYDSVLNELNKDNPTKFNKNNVSLNSSNKSKKNQVEPIIDQLNLTHTKKLRKNSNNSGDVSNSKAVKNVKETQQSDNDDSSSSIDLQLLFSEDNCGSDEEQMSQPMKDNDDLFIPLKKTPGKTNIRESIGTNTSQQNTTLDESIKNKNKPTEQANKSGKQDILNVSKNISLNESGVKKKKKHSISETAQETQDNLNVSKNVNTSMNESGIKKKKKHSISEPVEDDTEDNLNASKNVNISLNASMKKKKKQSISEPAEEEIQDNMNVSITKKKKKHSISEPAEDETQDNLNVSKNVSMSLNANKKKQKKHSISEPAEEEIQDNLNISLNTSSKKKKKHSISEAAGEETQDTLNVSKNINVSLNESGIKKKKKHSISEPVEEVIQEPLNISKNVNISLNESGIKKKKKHSLSEPSEEILGGALGVEVVLNASKKKKRKSSLAAEPEGDLFFIDTTGTLQDNKENATVEPNHTTPKSEKKNKKQTLDSLDNATEESNPPLTPKSEKKKKKQKQEVLDNTPEEANSAVTPKSEKKKKKQKLKSLVHDDDSDGAPDEAPYQSEKAGEMDLENIEIVSETADSAKKKHKKKKKKKSASASNQSGEIENINRENTIPSNSKKRKRKASNAENSQESRDAQESVETGKHNELVGSNKKRKISHNEGNISASPGNKKSKKRKHRDDDGDNKESKVKKDSSFQEVHIPRLPDNIIRQLDNKPKKVDTGNVISTSNFIVENARQKRAKPSNYLEESIYLDEKSPLAKKQKHRIKKPKVLPFIPTASISDSGFTSNFKIKKLSRTTTFEAEPITFSKELYLQKNHIKRLGTYDRYKKQMHHKMSKF